MSPPCERCGWVVTLPRPWILGHGRTEEIPAMNPAVTIWHCLDCGIYRERAGETAGLLAYNLLD